MSAEDRRMLAADFARAGVLSLLEKLQGQPRIGSLALEICDDIIKYDVARGDAGEDDLKRTRAVRQTLLDKIVDAGVDLALEWAHARPART